MEEKQVGLPALDEAEKWGMEETLPLQLPLPAWTPPGVRGLYWGGLTTHTGQGLGPTCPTRSPAPSPKGPESQAFATIWMNELSPAGGERVDVCARMGVCWPVCACVHRPVRVLSVCMCVHLCVRAQMCKHCTRVSGRCSEGGGRALWMGSVSVFLGFAP